MATRKRLTTRPRRRDRRDGLERKIDHLTKLVKGIIERLDDEVDLTKLKTALGRLKKGTGELKDAVDQNAPKG